MKTTIKINSIFGKLLFEYESENNSIKKTLGKALKENADLSDANLRNADLRNTDLSNADLRNTDLRNADLSDADLSDADLSDANLRNADLRNADLSDADLRNADLSDANLRNADLSDANLRNADLRNADLSDANLRNADLRNAKKAPMFCKWSVGITDDKISIGCETKTIKEWDKFFKSDTIIETKRDTEEFKQIQAVYNGFKAYYKTLN